MAYHSRLPIPKEFPIERIFRKVTHRKMTALERTYFRLKPEIRLHARKLG